MRTTAKCLDIEIPSKSTTYVHLLSEVYKSAFQIVYWELGETGTQLICPFAAHFSEQLKWYCGAEGSTSS